MNQPPMQSPMNILQNDYFSKDIEVRPLDEETKKILEKTANAIRQLSIDAIQKANSGHPGLPLGCAEIAAYLYGVQLKHNPKNPSWLNRDRFVLSAGHGSMLLYSSLYLAGFDLSLEDIKHFRKLNSKTPGHPEALDTPGVETTTGPLGQGTGNAVGMALGLKIAQSKFNTEKQKIFDSKVYCLCSDGDIMEGVSAEVSSLAGHWQLDNLVFIYDSNHISLDGPTSECLSEDTKARYQAYGWEVYEIDGHNFDEIHQVLTVVKEAQTKPVLIIANTIIGKGAPNKAGTHKVHGAPLGEEEVEATKEALHLPKEEFYVPQAVKDYFDAKLKKDQESEKKWQEIFDKWAEENPKLFEELCIDQEKVLPSNLESKLKNIEIKPCIATRSASHVVIQELAKALPFLIGGSADLSSSDKTFIEGSSVIGYGNFNGRNIKFGVREFGMATIATGLYLTHLFTPFVGTFLTFSDYMRNAIRLASLQRSQVIYQFTHDSIFLGEDGPTHQPVEHLAALRAMPNLHVIRPADSNEVKMAWLAALRYKGPTAIILSRQNLPQLEETNRSFDEGMAKGAYIIKKEKEKPDVTLFATGSEVSLALDVATELTKRGKDVRVVSMPCWEIFEDQSKEYQQSIVGGDLGKRVAIEAGVDLGWYKWIGREGISICVETFGKSASYKDLAEEYGFTVESILDRIL